MDSELLPELSDPPIVSQNNETGEMIITFFSIYSTDFMFMLFEKILLTKI